jgi:hypothetical protein
LISVNVTSDFLNGPRQHYKIGDLLIRPMSSRRWETDLTVSFWVSFRTSSRPGFGDWSGWSETAESALLNDWTKLFRLPRGVEIEAGHYFCALHTIPYPSCFVFASVFFNELSTCDTFLMKGFRKKKSLSYHFAIFANWAKRRWFDKSVSTCLQRY